MLYLLLVLPPLWGLRHLYVVRARRKAESLGLPDPYPNFGRR